MNVNDLEQIELTRIDDLPIQKLKKCNKNKKKLHIVYIMIWTKTCGGSKIIFEYVNRLSKKGHKMTIITYDKRPDWFILDKNVEFICLKENQKIEDNIPECDLIVATSWKNIYSAMKANCAPVVYFEQGGGHIFAPNTLSPIKREIVSKRIKEATFIYTVSEYSKNIIKEQYNRDAFVVFNAVDKTIFYPSKEKKANNNIVITAIGPEEFEFKHIDNIIYVVENLRKTYPQIIFNWISQTKPTKNNIPVIVNPPQQQIGEILRNTDIYICASDYESFGLPVLEAMTCGATIVTTNNGGISDFVEDEKNGLIIKKNDLTDMLNAVKRLIQNKSLRQKLAKAGIETSKRFDWDISVERIEKYYLELSNYEVIKDDQL